MFLLSACDRQPAAEADARSDGNSELKERLAAKRRELADGTVTARKEAPARPEPTPRAAPDPQPPRAVKAERTSHLPRRERLTRACHRDTKHMLASDLQTFCRCMVDTVISTRVSASLQDALIENFSDRDAVEAANPEFNRRWHRCRI